MQTLSDDHVRMLREESGISADVIEARGYRTVTRAGELEALGFARAQCRAPGLLLPVHCTDGSNGLYVYRPDNPREIYSGKTPDAYSHKVLKYEVPKGASVRLDCPPTCRTSLANPAIPLWITEGQKKADALASRGECVIALLGVWNWKGRNFFGGTTLLNDFDYIALENREVRIVFDSDVMTKPEVRQALDRLKEHLERKKAYVSVAYLPKSETGKNGVDDYLASGHSIDDLLALLEAPRPIPQPAAPIVELLDKAPSALRRPLALIDARAYAAVWPYARVTQREGVDKAGNIVKYDPPRVKTERRLFIVRDDGKIFGDDPGCEAMTSLGLEIYLPEVPPDEKLWSVGGFQAYRNGKRPDPTDVFSRLSNVVDQFIDFDKSFADQKTMCELIGCYIYATWFLDAFDVIGFLWPTGGFGSGKTHLLILVAELSFLGIVIHAGGSYASLRDLADYGATIAFDDAENLTDPRKSDPDKRTLLLAGNRRGSFVSLKEYGADKSWHTRYVNAFCPRLFSAIQLPDPVLGSRAIIIPLVRTADRVRGNAVLFDHKSWLCDRRTLVDDLWATSLCHLPEMPRYEKFVCEESRLTGRNLEPWRAILAVASFLDKNGVGGLFERMNSLSVTYQKSERHNIDSNDLTILVIKGLCHLANSANSAISSGMPAYIDVETQQVTEAVQDIVRSTEVDIDEKRINNKTVGRVLGKLRLTEVPRPGGKGSRKRRVLKDDFKKWETSYALTMP